MSVTICPHCRTRLNPYDDSLYCEACGGNIMRPQIVCERDDSVPAPFWSDAERGSDEERRSLLAELPDWVDVPADADVPTLREMLREIDDDDPRISDDDNEGSDSDV